MYPFGSSKEPKHSCRQVGPSGSKHMTVSDSRRLRSVGSVGQFAIGTGSRPGPVWYFTLSWMRTERRGIDRMSRILHPGFPSTLPYTRISRTATRSGTAGCWCGELQWLLGTSLDFLGALTSGHRRPSIVG